ncbi:Integrase-like, catalytic domain [Phytophthora cactorum]|nr:Integrase-like, catalytic domain [Phytophthora cactorum]
MASFNSRAQLVVSPPGSVGAPIRSEILSSHILGEENTIADADSQDPSPASIAALETAWRNISANTPLWPPPSRLPPGPSSTGNLHLTPADQLTYISDFIIDVRLRGMGSNKPVRDSTIRIALHGIRHFSEDAGLPFPTDNPQARRPTATAGTGIHRATRSLSTVVGPPRLRGTGSIGGGLCLDFFFVLRRSKIVATTATSFHWFALKTADVAVIDADGSLTLDPSRAAAVCIRLEGSKTNQTGPQVMRILSRSGHPLLRPVLGALLLLRSTGNLPAAVLVAVFTDKHGAPFCVTSARVAQAIQSTARSMGEDPRRYIRHPLRAGGATNIYRAGIGVQTIKFHGR